MKFGQLIIIFSLIALVSSMCCVKTFDNYGSDSRSWQIDKEINNWLRRVEKNEKSVVLMSVSYSVKLDGWDSHKSAMIHYCHGGGGCYY